MPRVFSVHVVIVGAGLGGLSAAIGIARAGHQATIVEQSEQLGEVGRGSLQSIVAILTLL
jgi:salicylate hydroxylase